MTIYGVGMSLALVVFVGEVCAGVNKKSMKHLEMKEEKRKHDIDWLK